MNDRPTVSEALRIVAAWGIAALAVVGATGVIGLWIGGVL